jgi:chemotaxis signal transduction protein
MNTGKDGGQTVMHLHGTCWAAGLWNGRRADPATSGDFGDSQQRIRKGSSTVAQDVQLVIFKLANEDYGLPIQKVQEINRMVPVTKLPQTPEFMEGIINLRGRVIPVVDLRKRFGLVAKPPEDDTRIMNIDIGGQTVGIIVDAVNESRSDAGRFDRSAAADFHSRSPVHRGYRQNGGPAS